MSPNIRLFWTLATFAAATSPYLFLTDEFDLTIIGFMWVFISIIFHVIPHYFNSGDTVQISMDKNTNFITSGLFGTLDFTIGTLLLYHIFVVIPRNLEPGVIGYAIIGVMAFAGMATYEMTGLFRKIPAQSEE